MILEINWKEILITLSLRQHTLVMGSRFLTSYDRNHKKVTEKLPKILQRCVKVHFEFSCLPSWSFSPTLLYRRLWYIKITCFQNYCLKFTH